MSNLSKWDQRFIKLAMQLAEWSKDPRTKVGCVLVSPGKHQFSFGYNGFPKGVPDTDEALADREVKNAMMVHAELNAILNAHTDVSGWSAYVTHPPCIDCCKALIQAGIIKLVCPKLDKKSKWNESHEFGLNLLIKSGLQIVPYDVLTSPGYDNQGPKLDTVTESTEKVLKNQDVTEDNGISLSCKCIIAHNAWHDYSANIAWCNNCGGVL